VARDAIIAKVAGPPIFREPSLERHPSPPGPPQGVSVPQIFDATAVKDVFQSPLLLRTEPCDASHMQA